MVNNTQDKIMSDEGKLYVGNISYKTDDDSLKDSFKQFGPVMEGTVRFSFYIRAFF